jgi:hypothetical protein
MIEALRRLPDQPVPSARPLPGLLDGLDQVTRLALDLIDRPAALRSAALQSAELRPGAPRRQNRSPG